MILRVGDIFKRIYGRGLFVVTGVTRDFVYINYVAGDFTIAKERCIKEYFLKTFRKIVDI